MWEGQTQTNVTSFYGSITFCNLISLFDDLILQKLMKYLTLFKILDLNDQWQK